MKPWPSDNKDSKAGRGWWRALAMLAAAAALTACGGGGSAETPVPEVSAVAGGRYFPLAAGDRWRAADAGAVTTDRVVGNQVVEGQTVTVVRTVDALGSSDSHYVKTEAAVTAVPTPTDDAYTRAIGPVDLMRFPLTTGKRYTALDKTITGALDADGDGRFDKMVVRVDVEVVGFERVESPGGNFDGALHLRTVVTQSATLTSNGETVTVALTADDWYALDVGLVRSVLVATGASSSRTESLLQSYKVGGLRSETVAPTVLTRTPADGSAALDAIVQLGFSEAMEASTLAAGGLSVAGPGGAVPGRAVWSDERTLGFVADAALASGSYTVTLAAGVEDFAGNPLAAGTSWRFTIDTEGPKVAAVSPPANAIEVPLNSVVSLTFDEAPDPATVNGSNFWIERYGSRIDATVALAGRVVTITPSQPLQQGSSYQTWVSRFVTDTLGNQAGTYSSFLFKADPGRFAAPQALPALGVATTVELADVDGDGRLDLLAAQASAQGQGQLRLMRRQADGSLSASAETLPTSAGCFPGAMAVADLDGDSLLDVAVATFGCGLEIVRQTSRGVWANQGLVSSLSISDLRAISLAGQSRPGLVATTGGRVILFRPAAGGGYQVPIDLYSVGYAMGQIEIGDVNGDTRPDIVVAGALDVGNGLLVALQRADGGFDVRTEPILNGTSSLAIGDVNGDGRADIVYPLSYSQALEIRLQTAQGTLADPVLLPTFMNPQAVRVADLNGDGRADILLGQDFGSVVAVYLQTATGGLADAVTYEAPGQNGWLRPLAVGELTGDGLVDVVVNASLLRQRPQAVSAGGAAATTAATAATAATRARSAADAAAAASATDVANTTGATDVTRASGPGARRRGAAAVWDALRRR